MTATTAPYHNLPLSDLFLGAPLATNVSQKVGWRSRNSLLNHSITSGSLKRDYFCWGKVFFSLLVIGLWFHLTSPISVSY